MKRSYVYLAAATLFLAGCSGSGGSLFGNDTKYKAQPATVAFTQSVIAVPNVPGPIAWSIDIGDVNASTGRYYLADRTNSGVDVFDAAANKYITTVTGGFAGNTGKSSASGPNGLIIIGNSKIYVGDGDGSVKIMNQASNTITGTIKIPNAKFRADEGSYDPVDDVVMIAHDAEPAGPLLTFIKASTDTVIGQVRRADATNGMEASMYVPQLGKFLQAVPQTVTNANGEIDVIDPVSEQTVAVYPIPVACGPTGISLGPQSQMVVSCGGLGSTLVMSAANGSLLAQINQAGGGDENAYDATTGRYYVANSNNTDNGKKSGVLTPVLTVIDANTNFWIQNIPIESHAHSVATYQGKVFMPLPSSGVAVFQ